MKNARKKKSNLALLFQVGSFVERRKNSSINRIKNVTSKISTYILYHLVKGIIPKIISNISQTHSTLWRYKKKFYVTVALAKVTQGQCPCWIFSVVFWVTLSKLVSNGFWFMSKHSLHEKCSFVLKVSSVNVINFGHTDLVIFTEEILNGKLYFLRSDSQVFHWIDILKML